MKTKKIIIMMLVFTIVACFAGFSKVMAASVDFSVPSSVTEGETITATISGSSEQWNLTLTANGIEIATTSRTQGVGVETISKSGTYTTTSAGTVTFKLTGDYSYTDDNDEVVTKDVNITKTVTVNAKQEEPVNPPSEGESGGSSEPTPAPEQTTPAEPNFKDVNLTMYSTGTINLRSSWSTQSSATQIAKDTELNVTGTSTETINGYVWYRVNYNGATKYVASNLLTDKKPQEEEKSNNANLKSLSIDGYEIKPKFSTNVISYTLEVGNDVNELNVKAEAEDSKSNVDIQGNKNLKVGSNTIKITVKAEDGTSKIYEINVTKNETVKLGLKTLKIKDTDIASKFKTDKYDYKIDVKNVDKLEIEAEANVANATIEILGNEDLKEGENLVTIMVKSADGAETVTYQITANKTIGEKTDIQATSDVGPIDTKLFLYGGIVLLALILLIILIIVLIKNKSKNKNEFEDDEEDRLYNFDKSNFKNEFSNDFNENIEDKQDSLEKEENYEYDYEEENDIEDEEEITNNIQEDDETENLEQEIEDMIKDKKPKKGKGKHF